MVVNQVRIVVTKSDMEILNAVCEGRVIKEIALERNSTYRSVSGRLDYLKRKYDCTNTTQLVAKFFRKGILK